METTKELDIQSDGDHDRELNAAIKESLKDVGNNTGGSSSSTHNHQHQQQQLDQPEDSASTSSALTLDPLHAHPLEVKACPEFFTKEAQNPFQRNGKPKANLKNAERYLLIRNTILNEWRRIKPKYLLKSAVRPLLKGQGDVHAITRVHEFLERIGCINVDPDFTGVKSSSIPAAFKKRKLGNDDEVEGDDDGGEGADDNGWLKFFQGEPAKRQAKRVRNQFGEWVDKSELRDGRTIVHGEDGRPLSDEEEIPISAADIAEERRLMIKNAKYFADEELMKLDPDLVKKKRRQIQRQYYHYGNDIDDDMNEFRLIPLEKYKEPEKQAPFKVIVESNVQLVIDFHAHLAETEIIGLLGGRFDEMERVLYVENVFPCKSISTTIQCEMDPESEVKAHIHFASQNKVVVGWYHSHPTFDPNPSIRDIETQTDHQHLFLRDGDGIEPFVGAIYSPYDSRTEGVVSKSEWMCVGNQLSESGKYR
ncbi:UNVERIFIED_CONTAM: Myb-like, SWIRM and MPN domains 1 [Siphonaria sp. JEL0065]|nr:Myb-like, SWIRM and MPN domains 1 [Siphonaria sp. JEL0065]